MIQPFVEDFNSDKVAPTESGCEQFDFDAVERAFGELRDDPDQRERLVTAMRFLFDWMIRGDLRRTCALRVIGKRALAAAWVVDPARFNNDSLRSIAKQLGCTAANISPLTAQFSRLTGIVNEFKDHDWRTDHEKTDQH